MADGRHLGKLVISQPWFDRFRQNLARWRSSTLLTVPTVKNVKFQKSKMAADATLKNLKIDMSQPRLDRFWQNLAQWRSSYFLTVPIIKNVKFYKSKMVAAAILKNLKSRYLDNGLTDRHEIWHGDEIRHLRFVPQLEICNFKNPTWWRPPFWTIEKSPYLGRSFCDFNEIWQCSVRYNLKFKDIQDGGGRLNKN